jgi:hypothetical protein
MSGRGVGAHTSCPLADSACPGRIAQAQAKETFPQASGKIASRKIVCVREGSPIFTSDFFGETPSQKTTQRWRGVFAKRCRNFGIRPGSCELGSGTSKRGSRSRFRYPIACDQYGPPLDFSAPALSGGTPLRFQAPSRHQNADPPAWPENFVIATPQERYPENAVRVSKATHATRVSPKP